MDPGIKSKSLPLLLTPPLTSLRRNLLGVADDGFDFIESHMMTHQQCNTNDIYYNPFNPFVGKRTNSSATYPYPFRYPWGPLLSLFVATKDYYRMSSHVFPSFCSSLDIFARFAPFLRQKTRVFDLYSI